MQRSLKIIVVWLVLYNPLFFNAQAQAGSMADRQQQIDRFLEKHGQFSLKKVPFGVSSAVLKYPSTGFTSNSSNRVIPVHGGKYFPVPGILYPLPASHYAKTLGYFCKQELKLDKLTSVPLRFRLGSVEYTDRMERKANATGPR